MKIYIVSWNRQSYDCVENEIIEVFDSEEKALNYVNDPNIKNRYGRFKDYDRLSPGYTTIDEWDVK